MRPCENFIISPLANYIHGILIRMRQPRHFVPDRCYHLISRVAHRAFYLDEDERTRFVERMRRVAYFSCVEILAYCVMSNHFHVLVYVPAPRELCGDEVLARVQALYVGARLADLPGTRAASAATRQQQGGALHCVRGNSPCAAANVSPDCEGMESLGMKLLHHSYSTNGVRPSGPLWGQTLWPLLYSTNGVSNCNFFRGEFLY